MNGISAQNQIDKLEARILRLERDNRELREQLSQLMAPILASLQEFPDNEVYIAEGKAPVQRLIPATSKGNFHANS